MDRAMAMAVSSSPASSIASAPCINTPSLSLLRSRQTQCACVTIGRRSVMVAMAAGDAQDTEAESTGGTAVAEESATAPPINSELILSSALATPPASLINYANIQKALNGEALLTPDHYAALGVARSASYEEVEMAFRKRCQDVLQQGTNEEEMRNMLRALKFSYDILSSEEERRLYDWSLGQLQSPGGLYVWPYEEDITQDESEQLPPEVLLLSPMLIRCWRLIFLWLSMTYFLHDHLFSRQANEKGIVGTHKEGTQFHKKFATNFHDNSPIADYDKIMSFYVGIDDNHH